MNPSDAAGKGGEAVASWMVREPGWSLLVLEFGVLAARDPQIAQPTCGSGGNCAEGSSN